MNTLYLVRIDQLLRHGMPRSNLSPHAIELEHKLSLFSARLGELLERINVGSSTPYLVYVVKFFGGRL